ncbi:hypothetical protein ACJ73_08098 [Blastomyces percursus]|uniref:Uncharacterized protein n=1 Tax=Blastomyces percursus TaxID=1658174 RepID=A0A1J9PW33_9EURO|nr:hypothetical protein ACJ73_08098 [Blastomyces percursus]
MPAPESQFSDVERPSHFDLNALIESEGLFISQEVDAPLDDEKLAERIESQFSLQDAETPSSPAAPASRMPSCSPDRDQIPELKGRSVEMNNRELVDRLNMDCQDYGAACFNQPEAKNEGEELAPFIVALHILGELRCKNVDYVNASGSGSGKQIVLNILSWRLLMMSNKYTVYITETGPVVGSGSAIPSSTAPVALNTPNSPQSARKRSATLTSPLRSPGRQNRTIRKSRYNVLSQTISQSFWEVLRGEEDARDETLEMPVLGSRNTQDAHWLKETEEWEGG